MTLQVPFDGFAQSVQELLGQKQGFVTHHPSGALITAGDPQRGTIVVSVAEMPLDEARKRLEKEQFQVREGVWSLDGSVELSAHPLLDAYIVAVSYVSGEDAPGVWLDVFPSVPTQVQVLRAMYEEFQKTGEMGEVAFEEFMRLGKPNVVIASPAELKSFLDQKTDCP